MIPRPQRCFLSILVWVLLACVATLARAGDSEAEYTLQLGIKMFPTLIGGNLDLDSQRNSAGKLLLLVVYQDNLQAGEEVVKKMNNSIKVIYKSPVQIELSDVAGCKEFDSRSVAGIFLAEQLDPAHRAEIIRFGIKKKSVVFSSFKGDVQQGIMAGLHVATQVQPALNLAALRETGMRMNQLFFKVAKTYE
ncbi:MAG: hypothetical protein H7833_16210 [Magnetococcus sp. DMHC-1]|nr:hypothetical protein [Magnetococcales bacterium]